MAALAIASGQEASLFAVQNICHAGDNSLCSTYIYGGTWNLFQNTMGIECRFVDPADPENFRRATARVMTSVAPPAGYATTMVIGFDG